MTLTPRPSYRVKTKSKIRRMSAKAIMATAERQFRASFLIPPWAIGRTKDYSRAGALLPTRDGRVCGNACVISTTSAMGMPAVIVLTDAGTEMTLTKREVMGMFHPPQWLMDPDKCPGRRPHLDGR